ncbi:MAG: shikimate dehydrogenase [Sphingobacteriales bacterium]|jgi:shikimate dehydrogenase
MGSKLGLIGYPLSHSFSKSFFESKFQKEGLKKMSYENYPLDKIEKVKELLDNPEILGFNVTIPHKQTIIPFLNELEGAAKKIKAVNTVVKTAKGIIGYNTDVIGFKNSILPLLKKEHTNAFIFGTGGSAKAVAYVLDELGILYTNVSSSGRSIISYKEISKELIKEHKLLINCTPLGMGKLISEYPKIPYQAIGENHLCYDLIYNPEETVFLKKAKMQGAAIKNGKEMLELQALASWEIWQKERPIS